MDTFVDSSWYFLRYTDPHNDKAPFDRAIVDYWMPVDQYIGGIDHATGHLLYSRFFMKVLNELDLVGVREPFARLFHQGWVRQGGSKMSKSRGNVTAPDELVDALRRRRPPPLHPLHGPGRPGHGVDGGGRRGHRPLPAPAVARRRRGRRERRQRRASPRARSPGRRTQTIAKVTDDIDRRFVFNTPISAVMELVNELSRDSRRIRPRASPPRRSCR